MNIKQYLGLNSHFEDENGDRMSHSEMYTTIVHAIGMHRLVLALPASKEALLAAYEEDENLNNIPLQKWDSNISYVSRLLAGIGVTTSSLSQTVCIMKQTARLYIEEDEPTTLSDTENETVTC